MAQRFFHHYRGFFGRTCREWRASQSPTVKGLLYAYRSALTGIHLLRTGECVGDASRLAPLYGFERVAELVARKGRGSEHGALTSADGFEIDLQRLDSLLQAAHAESTLPAQAPNADAVNEFLVRMRKEHFG